MNNLLQSRRFFPLLITQFLGALNDNLFKNALLTLVVIKMTAQSDVLSNVIAGLFIFPFFLFSSMAGEIADKVARDKIARKLKLIEVFLMLGVAVSYFLRSIPLLIILVGLMGAQSAFFGPVKYALLPQQLKQNELISGNAYIEATTYLAILLGLILGTLLPIECSIVMLIALSVCGYLSARLILPAPAPRPTSKVNINLLESLYVNLCFLKKHRYIFQSVLGATWFWIIGAFAAVQIYPLCGKVLSAGNGTITFFLILFSLGVALGSFVCSRLLNGVINMVYVPVSAVGMAVCLLGLWLFSADYSAADHLMTFTEFLYAPKAFGLSLCMFALAFCGGLYIIPLNAFMQSRAPKAYTATIIAGNNIFNALGMVCVSVLSIILLKIGFSIPQLFLIMGITGFVVALYICSLLPDNLLRSVLQTLLRCLFRTQIKGLNNYYKAGKKVLIIANHASLWDGILLAAFMPERITFAITSEWTGKWFMPLIRLLVDFYPVDTTNPLSIRTLIEHIRLGKKVMIFPEGRITLTGKIMQVYDGAAMIAAKSGAKILPVRIDGAQYSSMSYVRDKFRCKLFPQINLTIAEARQMDPDILLKGRTATQNYLYRIMIEIMAQTAHRQDSLFDALRQNKKTHGAKRIIARNLAGETLSISHLLRQAHALAYILKSKLGEKSKIGLAVKNPLRLLVAVSALDCLGKTIVLFNPEKLSEQIKICPVDVILSQDDQSRAECPVLDLSKLKLNFLAFLGKVPNAKQNAKVIFIKNNRSFEYTMSQLLENYTKLDCVLPFNTRDRAINCLPMENGDNFVLGVILPLLSGANTLFCNGEHIKLLPHLCYDYAATLLFASENIYEIMIKNASPFDFFSIRMAFSCGNKIDDELLTKWLKQYNVRILESYTPKDSVLIRTVNTPLYNRFGSLGQSLPQTEIQTNEVLFDQEGFAFCK